MSDYLTTAETAKLVRAALKAKFPGVKFSVRSENYAGGASIRIHWVDGPLAVEVDAIAKKFEGATFDGMRDLKEYRSILVDGVPRRTHCDFVFTYREVTERAYREALAEVEAFYGVATVGMGIRTHESFHFRGVEVAAGLVTDFPVANASNEYLSTIVYRALRGSLRQGDLSARRFAS